jgi:four helix bundle protein
VAGARSHTELIAWQRAYELKVGVYELIRSGRVVSDRAFCDQIRRSSSSAPRNIAEGFGRYLPGEFMRYLRLANGELKETFESLRDGVDRGYFKEEDAVQLQRLSMRASKAATMLIAYLRHADTPHEPRR